jgi:cathepsin D
LTEASGFSNSDADSLLGLGFYSISASKTAPWFLNVINQKQVSTPEFSFYLGRAADGTGANSQLTVGGRDPSKFKGTPTTIAVSTPGYWQIPIDHIKINGQTGVIGPLLTKGQAAIDTGTTIQILSTAAATYYFLHVFSAVPIPTSLMGGGVGPTLFAFPCGEKLPSIALTFGGVDFEIAQQDLNLGALLEDDLTALTASSSTSPLSGVQYCLAAIAGFDIALLNGQVTEQLFVVVSLDLHGNMNCFQRTLWLILDSIQGDTFLKNWYSIYSYNRGPSVNNGPSVSFAKSI